MMIKKRLAALRELMKEKGVQAYLIPSTDAHQSEYVPDLWQRRRWISGFDGSAGDVAVTMKEAGLWTDSRYFLQAEEQLSGSGIDLYKLGLPDTPTIAAFLKEKLKEGQKAAIDPRVISFSEARSLQIQLQDKRIELVFLEENLIDKLWQDQPPMPLDSIDVHELKYAGESVESKLKRIREKMQALNTEFHILTTLDGIAWTFNIRSKDIEYNPLTIAYAVIGIDGAKLFVKKEKVTAELKRHLSETAEIFDYDDFAAELGKIPWESTILLDKSAVNQWVVGMLKGKYHIVFKESPVTRFKAVKNKTELKGFENCHIRDGAAMVKFFTWLEDAVPRGGVTELSAADKLESLRREVPLFKGLSFETISAYGAHGAIVHYSSTEKSNVELKPEGLFLLDSGGQYLDGTTDITRTVALGEPTAEQKDRFTRVLKGHIDLALAKFPQGTQGIQLDTIARKALWDIRENYGHGTGHGVGSYLGVHEGPQAISYYRGIGVALEPGMILSNEPGFYKEGEYGIRIETLVQVVNSDEKNNFYEFKTATLCPIDLKLVDKSLLNSEEISYLNAYHKRIKETLSPLLGEKERKWLEEKTKPIRNG
jgi:Xaa-Pro aminopeptidase